MNKNNDMQREFDKGLPVVEINKELKNSVKFLHEREDLLSNSEVYSLRNIMHFMKRNKMLWRKDVLLIDELTEKIKNKTFCSNEKPVSIEKSGIRKKLKRRRFWMKNGRRWRRITGWNGRDLCEMRVSA